MILSNENPFNRMNCGNVMEKNEIINASDEEEAKIFKKLFPEKVHKIEKNSGKEFQ